MTAGPPRRSLLARIRGRLRREFRRRFLAESCYRRLREPKRKGWVPLSPDDELAVAAALRGGGCRVDSYRIDVEGYRRWMERAAPIYRAQGYGGGQFQEKALEHYLAGELLRLRADDLYVDIASAQSPVPELYEAIYGCRTMRQDLDYPPGVHDRCIGGDAANLPLPAGTVNAMALHCSFEHFEGDADSRFIREAGRVLAPGGRLCILPLYFGTEYATQTDPAAWPSGGMEFEPEAVVYCESEYRNLHGRFYSAAKFLERVVAHLGGLQLRVLLVENATAVDPSCYVRFIGLFERGG